MQYRAAYSEKAQVRGAPQFLLRNVDDIGKAFQACLVDAGENEPELKLRDHARSEDGALIWLPARKKLGETEVRPRWKGQGTPNTLRHPIHTYLAAKNVPKAQIDTAAGHSTDGGTGDKYNHLRPDYLKDFVAGVEAFWAEVDAFTNVHRQILR